MRRLGLQSVRVLLKTFKPAEGFDLTHRGLRDRNSPTCTLSQMATVIQLLTSSQFLDLPNSRVLTNT